MKVRATRTGAYPTKTVIDGKVELNWMRRREGDVFELFDYEITDLDPRSQQPRDPERPRRLLTVAEQFSNRWMERVDSDEPLRTTGAQEAVTAANADLTRSKRRSA